MTRPYALLRAGFPYVKTLGTRRFTNFPMDLAIGEEGRLYTLCDDFGARFIDKLTWEDEDLGWIPEGGKGEGALKWPGGLIRDREENLYVSDQATHTITSFTKEGEYLGRWGDHGDGDGQLNRPSGIAFDAEENIYVSDTMNHRTQKFTKDGKFLTKWGAYGDGDGEFNMPWGITVDELGDVYVADWRNDRIQKFNGDGKFVFKLGTSGNGEGQFNRPAGVEVDSDGDIYVADRGNDRVLQFDANGRYVDQFIGDATLSKSAYDYIKGAKFILRVRESTPLERSKRFRGPNAVRFDDQKRMYVVDSGSHRIQVYQKEAYPLGPADISEPLTAPALLNV